MLATTPPTHVAIVHLETTTGILNPIEEIAKIVREHGCRFIVDAMSSFGGVPIELSMLQPDYFVSSANKCLEGVLGFSYVLAHTRPCFPGPHLAARARRKNRERLPGICWPMRQDSQAATPRRSIGTPPKLLIASTMNRQPCSCTIRAISSMGFRIPVVVSR